MSKGPHIDYMVRRETHSSRAISAVIVSLLIIAGLVYLIVEAILALSGKEPLLATWTTMVTEMTKLPDNVHVVVLVLIGIVLALFGLILLGKAIAPGTLGRHSIDDERSAYVVDDGVIAAAVSAQARDFAGVQQGQVSTSVGQKDITVTLTPTSGIPQDANALEKKLTDVVNTYNLSPKPTVDVTLTDKGVVAK